MKSIRSLFITLLLGIGVIVTHEVQKSIENSSNAPRTTSVSSDSIAQVTPISLKEWMVFVMKNGYPLNGVKLPLKYSKGFLGDLLDYHFLEFEDGYTFSDNASFYDGLRTLSLNRRNEEGKTTEDFTIHYFADTGEVESVSFFEVVQSENGSVHCVLYSQRVPKVIEDEHFPFSEFMQIQEDNNHPISPRNEVIDKGLTREELHERVEHVHPECAEYPFFMSVVETEATEHGYLR